MNYQDCKLSEKSLRNIAAFFCFQRLKGTRFTLVKSQHNSTTGIEITLEFVINQLKNSGVSNFFI